MGDLTPDSWTVVTTKRGKTCLTNAKCHELEKQLNIRNLAETLRSQASKDLQALGYTFWKIVEAKQIDTFTSPANTEIQFLLIPNKWQDHACFSRPLESSCSGTVIQPCKTSSA
jgi:hypothetical protein